MWRRIGGFIYKFGFVYFHLYPVSEEHAGIKKVRSLCKLVCMTFLIVYSSLSQSIPGSFYTRIVQHGKFLQGQSPVFKHRVRIAVQGKSSRRFLAQTAWTVIGGGLESNSRSNHRKDRISLIRSPVETAREYSKALSGPVILPNVGLRWVILRSLASSCSVRFRLSCRRSGFAFIKDRFASGFSAIRPFLTSHPRTTFSVCVAVVGAAHRSLVDHTNNTKKTRTPHKVSLLLR